MDIIYMGTPEFAVAPLKALIKHHHVTAVITQPDKRKGRGNKVKPTPVKEVALSHNIDVYQPEKIKDPEFTAFLSTLKADLFIVVAYGQLLSKTILNMPKYGCINIHASLLPKYRGPAPIQWAVLNGDHTTGVSIMFMDEEMDTGDIIISRSIDISTSDTSGSLHEKLSDLGCDALLETIQLIENNTVSRKVQRHEEATYAPMLKKEDGHIYWRRTSQEIINQIHGLNPWPSAYCFINENLIKIWDATRTQEDYPGEPGTIVAIDKKRGIFVKTGDGCLLIKEIQQKGAKKMSAPDFLRGNNLDVNTVLT